MKSQRFFCFVPFQKQSFLIFFPSIIMAPRNTNKLDTSSQKESVEVDSREIKLWTLEWVQLAIFISSFGVKTEIDIDGRKTEVFAVEGFNCRGFKYVIQVWGSEAAAFEEFFRFDYYEFASN